MISDPKEKEDPVLRIISDEEEDELYFQIKNEIELDRINNIYD